MNKKIILSALAVALSITAVTADARGGDRGGMRAEFSTLDADGNGEVTQAEMLAYAQQRFDEVDTNGDGSLSAEELIAARSADVSDRMERRINRMLERADANDNGTLEFDEMRHNSDRAAARFERVDTDGSGGISEAEMEAAKEARGDRKGKGRGDRDGNSDEG